MGAGLAGGPPCLPHSQVFMGAGLAGRPPCLPGSTGPNIVKQYTIYPIVHYNISYKGRGALD